MKHLDGVHITSEKFENAALFLRLDLPSTLIRHENAALFLRLGLPSTLIRHENAALFLRLGLPSTLIRHENGAFRKRSSNRRNLLTENMLTTELFENYGAAIIIYFPCPSFPKWSVIVAFSNPSGAVWRASLCINLKLTSYTDYKYLRT